MNLFQEKKIGKTTLENAFFRAATFEGLADERGHLTDELIDIYEDLAKGQVGAIITGYANIVEEEKANENMLGIYSDEFIEEYSKLTDIVHSYGVKIILQIAYGGSMSSLNADGVLGPSEVENERSKIMPKKATLEDIRYIKNAFTKASVRAQKAGFDGVELHCAHGYFLSQWLSPKYNIRQDMYGGSIDNRARLICEILEDIRKNVSDDFLLIVKQNSEDFTEEGLCSDDSILASKLFEASGADAIEISGGDLSSKYVTSNNLGASRGKLVRRKKNESYFKEHAMKLSYTLDIPVILTGGNRHLSILEEIAEESKVSFFGICRPLICETDLIKKWKTGQSKASKCVSCNGCFSKDGRHCILNS